MFSGSGGFWYFVDRGLAWICSVKNQWNQERTGRIEDNDSGSSKKPEGIFYGKISPGFQCPLIVSDLEPDIKDITVINCVILAVQVYFSLFFQLCLASCCHKFCIFHRFCPDEASFKIGMYCSCGIWR